ncbi:MAG: MBL fold metallo-hydrolase, partial [Halothiobacillaceae bacterium]
MTEHHSADQQRRAFLRAVASAAALGSLSLPTLAPLQAFAQEMDMVVKGPKVPDIAAKKLSDHVYAVIAPDGFPNPKNQGMMSNVTFVVTSKGVVIIDSGASVQIGEMALRQIRKVTDKPVIAVFNTHYHGDHWLGNHAFVEAYKDIPIYAHPLTTSAIKTGQGEFWLHLLERSTDNATLGTIVTPPNKEVKHGDEIKFGDVTIR